MTNRLVTILLKIMFKRERERERARSCSLLAFWNCALTACNFVQRYWTVGQPEAQEGLVQFHLKCFSYATEINLRSPSRYQTMCVKMIVKPLIVLLKDHIYLRAQVP